MTVTRTTQGKIYTSTGSFKILIEGALGRRYQTFVYRTCDGITEIKQADNSFAPWTVGRIPFGAILN